MLGEEYPGREAMMGAWGAGSFENDESRDWLGNMRERRGLDWLEIINTLIAGSNRDTSDEVRAIAAAEIVSAAAGHPVGSIPAEAVELANQLGTPTSEVVLAARSTVEQLLQDSELKELFESDEEWADAMLDLARRLAGR